MGGLSKYDRGSMMALCIDLTHSSEGLVVNTTFAWMAQWKVFQIIQIIDQIILRIKFADIFSDNKEIKLETAN